MKTVLRRIFGPFVSLLLACTCIGLAVSCRINESSGEKGEGLEAGDKIPDFKVRMDDGREISAESLEGDINLIIFFHTMCSDCVRELPILQKVYDKYRDDENVNMILISRSQQDADVRAYWTEHGLTLPYSAQDNDRVYKKFALSVIPRIYITDRHNIIRFIHTDNPIATEKEILAEIAELQAK